MKFQRISSMAALMYVSFLVLAAACPKEVGAYPLAPDFSLSDISGETVSLGQYRGNVVLLDFWASWCLPCKMTIPLLVKLQEQYREKGFVILGVSMDDPQLIKDQDLFHLKQMTHINYPILRFNQKIIEDYFRNDQLAVPTMIVIDRNGRIRDRIVGYQPDAVEKSLAEIMK